MKIKRSESRSFPAKILFSILSGLKRKDPIIYILFLIFFVILGSSFAIVSKKGIIAKLSKKIPFIIQGFITDPPERIMIDMNFENYQKLAKKRDEAVKLGYLVKGPDDYVPARITHNGHKVRVDIRLKGEFASDHMTGDKWSFRVEVKRGDTLFGMRRFSLHRPKARWYLNEWVFHNILAHEGLVALRYKFINVTLNGKDLGLYALEEHFGKYLIEHSKFRQGLVIHYDDNLAREAVALNKDSTLESGKRSHTYFSTEIRSYEMGKVLKSPELMNQFKTALELTGRLRNGELKLHEAFDVAQLAKFYAACDLMGAWHNSLYPNFMIYYNPVTSKLEPIGFDAENAMHGLTKLTAERFSEREEEKGLTAWWEMHYFHLWQDEEFTRIYLSELERISDPEYVDKILKDIKEPMKDNISHLWTLGLEGITSQSYEFIRMRLHENAQAIRTKLDVVKGMHAYFVKATDENLILKIGNIETIPVEIKSITSQGQQIVEIKDSLVLNPRPIYSPIQYDRHEFKFMNNSVWSDDMLAQVQVHYTIPGTSIQKQAKVFAWDFLDDDFFKEDFIRKKPNFRQFSFFDINEQSKTIKIKPGKWDVAEDIIISPGWRIEARRGIALNLKNSAKILSYSPLEWIGHEGDPIRIISEDQSGQGIVVIKAKGLSTLRHVIFDNLSNPEAGGWSLTGAVTFYESEVHIAHCHFLNSRSEDSLNLIRSEFTMYESLFKDSDFDAVDFDFSEGEIKKVSFARSGNDAIDFSGSLINIEDVFISGSGDKGISIGEASRINMNNLTIKRCNIAIASKDSSEATIEQIKISESNKAIALYQKKSEFGPTSVNVKNLSLSQVKTPYLVQKSSTLSVDGKHVVSNQEEAEEFLAKYL